MKTIVLVNIICSPYMGSESSVGWGFYIETRKLFDRTILITSERSKEDIELYKERNKSDNVEVYYVPWEYRKAKFHFLQQFVFDRSMNIFQQKAFRLVQQIIMYEKIDVVHKISPIGFREPGYFWKLDVPSVWGPVGGMAKTPWQMLFCIQGLEKFRFLLRNIGVFYSTLCQKKLLRATKSYSRIIPATSIEKKHFKSRQNVTNSLIPVGEPLFLNDIIIPKRDKDELFKIVWVGSIIPSKALNLVLEVIAYLKLNFSEIPFELHIVGDGKSKNTEIELCERLKITNSVVFYGKKTREETCEIISKCHCFCSLSLIEGTPTVIIEAEALGLPIIALNYGGIKDMVEKENGFLIEGKGKNYVIKKTAACLVQLYSDEKLRYEMGEKSIQVVKKYSWENKRFFLVNMYDDLLGNNQ